MSAIAATIGVLIVMGVAGSGKTTVGRLLATRTGWAFRDADDYHGTGNVEKMRNGIPLTDADRIPWLDTLRRDVIAPSLEKGEPTVLTCSALKASYRERLGADDTRVRMIYLKGDHRLLRERLQHRAGHYMGPEMLASQFEVLEEPEPDENAVVVDAAGLPDVIVEKIMKTLHLPDVQ